MGKKIQCIGRYVMDNLTLGKGNFARVELATHGVTGCKVAVKILDTRKIKEEYVKINLHREARILGQLRHPNIIRLYETLKATTLYCLVLEYSSGGDLQAFIKSQKEARLLENKARPFFRQLISAIHFLHERGVAHRDLKMENILLDEKRKNIKVIDFGLSNTFTHEELMKTHCGSLEYAAPELIASSDRYGPEVDIWSLGIILYAMLIGKLPFSTHYTDQYRRQKLLAQIEKGLINTHKQEMILHSLSIDAMELLNRMIEPSVDDRLPLLECESHHWVTSHNKVPFHPFLCLPKDKAAKTQEVEIDTDAEEVIDELCDLLKTPREEVEKTVHESKCDDYSAMFNMLLDHRRIEKGMFDVDFTLKSEVVKKERHRKKHHRRATSKHKTNPAIHCPDGEASDHEGEHRVAQSHNSTNFDLMALCSAPTWLGGDRRKTRRKKSPMPPHSPFNATEGAKTELEAAAATAAGGHEHSNLLSPSQASSQVSALLRRNSSRRRSSRRPSSADPPSRHGSTHSRRSRRHRPGTPGSDPHSPHSPNNPNNPEIKISTPKHSPLASVKRPANLVGLKECYNASSTPPRLKRTTTLGPHTSYSRSYRHREGKDQVDSADRTHSDSSNPCSTTNLHEAYSDGSHEMLSKSGSRSESRNSITSHELLREQSVESKIAATDIRSIVRPKQYVLKGKVNGQQKSSKADNSLQIPKLDDSSDNAVSPEIIIESMQPTLYANLSGDEKIEKRQLSCEIPKSDNEKRVEQEKSDTKTSDVVSSVEHLDNINSSTELLGAACSKPLPIVNTVVTDDRVIDSLSDIRRVDFYANDDDVVDSVTRPCANEDIETYCGLKEPIHLIADLHSKNEKISLDDADVKLLMQDDVTFVDSSDHNSSQENFFSRRRNRLKESLTSDENESVSAPILLSPRELGLSLTHGESSGEALSARPRNNSVLSSRHGSTPSVRFVMPSTPIRQMFKTPIARIESFHSDDFDVFSDVDALVTSSTPSPSPTSTQTPTVPCFQYKLNSRRKKNFLGKSAKNRRKYMKDGVQYARDGIMGFLPEKPTRVDGRTNDPMFSSSSECGSDGQVPDGDKASNASKAKIFPMEKDDDPQELKANAMTAQLNDKTRMISESQGNQNNTNKTLQNSTCKSFLSKPTQQEPETKKSSWRKGFVHLLKKKKFSNVNAGNNNNDFDSPSRNRTGKHRTANNSSANNRSTRNGHARGTVPVSPGVAPEVAETNVDTEWSQTKAVQNNVKPRSISGTIDKDKSPTPSPSPSKTKVYDFTIVSSDTSKSKHCLLSWKACRECTFSDDHSSSEGSEGNVCISHPVDHVADRSSIPMTTFQSTSFITCRTAQS